jgi:hypothetical protein
LINSTIKNYLLIIVYSIEFKKAFLQADQNNNLLHGDSDSAKATSGDWLRLTTIALAEDSA